MALQRVWHDQVLTLSLFTCSLLFFCHSLFCFTGPFSICLSSLKPFSVTINYVFTLSISLSCTVIWQNISVFFPYSLIVSISGSSVEIFCFLKKKFNYCVIVLFLLHSHFLSFLFFVIIVYASFLSNGLMPSYISLKILNIYTLNGFSYCLFFHFIRLNSSHGYHSYISFSSWILKYWFSGSSWVKVCHVLQCVLGCQLHSDIVNSAKPDTKLVV